MLTKLEYKFLFTSLNVFCNKLKLVPISISAAAVHWDPSRGKYLTKAAIIILSVYFIHFCRESTNQVHNRQGVQFLITWYLMVASLASICCMINMQKSALEYVQLAQNLIILNQKFRTRQIDFDANGVLNVSLFSGKYAGTAKFRRRIWHECLYMFGVAIIPIACSLFFVHILQSQEMYPFSMLAIFNWLYATYLYLVSVTNVSMCIFCYSSLRLTWYAICSK